MNKPESKFIYIVRVADQYGSSCLAACLTKEEAEAMAESVSGVITDEVDTQEIPIISWPTRPIEQA